MNCVNNIIPDKILNIVVKKYNDNGHAYHNWSHILDIFKIAIDKNIKLSDSQKIAIIFHDIVYDVENVDNEENSALMMLFHLRNLNIPMDILCRAYTIILDTKNHEPSIDESKIVLDLDMSHLALERNKFLIYRKKIKEEYSHISDTLFYKGEIEFFQNLLKKKKYYLQTYLRRVI